jgi:hypothetical protein
MGFSAAGCFSNDRGVRLRVLLAASSAAGAYDPYQVEDEHDRGGHRQQAEQRPGAPLPGLGPGTAVVGVDRVGV